MRRNAHPREQINISNENAWLLGPWFRIIAEYNQSLREFPNPPGVTLTDTNVGR